MRKFTFSQVRRVTVTKEIEAEDASQAAALFEEFAPELPDGLRYERGGQRPARLLAIDENGEG